ncbi:energy-coupling factor transporter transmembrane component T family protein [Xanthobacter autotrophicus]|uniref:energy-coupling factor transporter transmembrane component T family protein n=1 Tax=Xanthobacter autotrophicus TaxID=280 RepID=UPI00372CBC33
MIAGYLSGSSLLHRLPAGVKLMALAVLSVFILPIGDPLVLAGVLVAVLLVYAGFGRRGLLRILVWRSMVPLLVLVFVLQVWAASLSVAAASVLRIAVMVLMADLVTLSTRFQDMMDAVAVPLKPLARFGLDPERLALAVALVLRFVPVLLESWRGREEAWRARSPRRPGLVLIGAFFSGALSTADQVAEALDARGFGMPDQPEPPAAPPRPNP